MFNISFTIKIIYNVIISYYTEKHNRIMAGFTGERKVNYEYSREYIEEQFEECLFFGGAGDGGEDYHVRGVEGEVWVYSFQ